MRRISLWQAAPALAALAFAGCEFTNPVDGINLFVNVKSAPTQAGVRIVDATTGRSFLTSSATPVTVTFTGAAASLIVDESAASIPNNILRINNGPSIFTFGLKGTVGTTVAPNTVTVLVTAPGYVAKTQTLTFADAEQDFTIALVRGSGITAGDTDDAMGGAAKSAALVNVQLSGQVTCEAKNVVVYPSLYVYYLPGAGAPPADWQSFYIDAGKSTINGLTEGAEYTFGTRINGVWEAKTAVLSASAPAPDGVKVEGPGANSTYKVNVEFATDDVRLCD